MTRKNKIRLYTYHGKYLRIKHETGNSRVKTLAKIADKIFDAFYLIGLAVLKFLLMVKNFLAAACFYVGSLVVSSFTKTYKGIKKDISNTRLLWPKRFGLLLRAQYAKTLLMFFSIAALGWIGLGSMHLIANALEIKNKIMQTAFLGNSYLTQAKDALSSQDFSQAENRFALASQAFSQGQQNIRESGQTLNQLLSLVPQKRDADSLLSAADLIARAGQGLSGMEAQLASLNISESGINAENGDTATIFHNVDSGLSQSLAQLTQAQNLIAGVDPNNLPAQNRQSFNSLKDELNIAQFALSNFKDVFSLGESMLLGDKNVLILLENNNELRATGGFIGTYGNLQIHDGHISKIAVSSIYDLDGQLTQNIRPPMPILNLNDRWYMRDANWYASYPDSAKKISDFYELEGGETPDLIIAVTPDIFVDWLKITGPITLPKYGITLTADNFVEQTQAITTLSNDLPTNSPKQILADLFPILLQKISSLDKSQWPQIIQSLQDNLNNKQIVLYAKDPAIESQLAGFHWAGSLEDTDRDFLSVVSSNLGGTKTDLEVDQKINLTTTVATDGTITNELDITRTNKMPDLPQTNNDSFIRIYAPLGSKLISNIGFDYKDLDYPAGEKYQTDDDVSAWESSLLKDVVSGTVIGQESGKTFFGNWLDLKGGQSKTVKVVYQLPFKLSDIDRYSLLLQKQIGATNQDFNWTLNFDNRQIVWKNFDTNLLNTDNLNSDILLDKDYFLGMVFQKQ